MQEPELLRGGKYAAGSKKKEKTSERDRESAETTRRRSRCLSDGDGMEKWETSEGSTGHDLPGSGPVAGGGGAGVAAVTLSNLRVADAVREERGGIEWRCEGRLSPRFHSSSVYAVGSWERLIRAADCGGPTGVEDKKEVCAYA